MKLTLPVAALLAALSFTPVTIVAGPLKLELADFAARDRRAIPKVGRPGHPGQSFNLGAMWTRQNSGQSPMRWRSPEMAILPGMVVGVIGASSIQPGRHYRLTAHYRTKAVSHEQLRVVARLDWQDASPKRVGYPDYAYSSQPVGDWKKVTLEAPAPEGATAVRIELSLGWSPQGTVWWDDVVLEEVAAPRPRPVRIGSVSLRPRQTGGKEGSVSAFLEALDEVALGKPDIVCLGEGITLIGHNAGFPALAEPIPGPTTERLGNQGAPASHVYRRRSVRARRRRLIQHSGVD